MPDKTSHGCGPGQRESMSRVELLGWISACLAVCMMMLLSLRALQSEEAEPAPPVSGAAGKDSVMRGEYLARAADCVACHSTADAKPFAGGRAFATPFGELYSTNITSDKQHGIGGWSDDDFLRAVREGIGKEGNLYPAMPYTSYTAMSRDDVLAIKDYLLSLPPVAQANRVNRIGFPFNQRWSLKFWNLAFFQNKRFQVDQTQSDAWNRGAYLSTALGHCGECHTPRNLGLAVSDHRAFAGTSIEGWLAPNLTPDTSTGLGNWSEEQLLSYLKTGHAEGRSSASGPMAEVIEHSLQHLSDADLRSMTQYLRSLTVQTGKVAPIELAPKPATESSAVLPGNEVLSATRGARLFAGDCVGCHQWNGRGRQSSYADLLGTRSVNDPDGESVVTAVLKGTSISINGQQMRMPAFGDKYSDEDVAALANYVIGHFGEKQGHVTRHDVEALRHVR